MVRTITEDAPFWECLHSAGSKLVVVDFFADWCGPCRMIAPFVEQLAHKYPAVVFLKVDVDRCRQIAASYGVTAMPTFVFIVNNQEVDRLRGANGEALESKVIEHSRSSAATGTTSSERIATPEEKAFLEKFVWLSKKMEYYEDIVAQTLALSLIPIEELEEKDSSNKKRLLNLALLRKLLRWFSRDFFSWVDSPKCKLCGRVTDKETRKAGVPTPEEEEFDVGRVEVYQCKSCSHSVRFPRYNDPKKLLETRAGRCGEWASCFTLCCRAVGFETRFVHDETDHVWCEVWIEDLDRWVHCDPCENVLDTPLLYERGWGKELVYIIAFASDHIREVTWRYTFDHLKILKRRTSCREAVLRNFINKLNARFERLMTKERKDELSRRYMKELVEFISPNMQIREGSDAEGRGRITGSEEWKKERGEAGADAGASKKRRSPVVLRPNDSELACKLLTLEYNCVKDEYKRGTDIVPGWESFVNKQKNVLRKEEFDWKMTYLCRKDGKSDGEISWSFDLNGLTVKSVDVLLDGMTEFGKGNISATLCCGDTCSIFPPSGRLILEGMKGGQLEVKVTFAGGEGDIAWQQAQLFRTRFDSAQSNMIIAIEFA